MSRSKATPIDNAASLADDAIKADPFPSLPPCLLSAAHIEAYVKRTGMLNAFDRAALKSASYEVKLRGEVVSWDDEGRKHKTVVDDDTAVLELAPNSITFVQVEPIFRLPPYIAIRFNLRIHHVHRGLLLGTGPLVDPGFEGKLLIPLHNLTATAYFMDLNEALIWVEFTKTSHGLAPKDYDEKPFPPTGKNLKPEDYLRKANNGFPIQSSIPDAQKQALKRSDKAQRQADKARNSLRKVQAFGLVAIVSAVVAVGAIVLTAMTLVKGILDGQSALYSRIGNLEGKLTGSAPGSRGGEAAGKDRGPSVPAGAQKKAPDTVR